MKLRYTVDMSLWTVDQTTPEVILLRSTRGTWAIRRARWNRSWGTGFFIPAVITRRQLRTRLMRQANESNWKVAILPHYESGYDVIWRPDATIPWTQSVQTFQHLDIAITYAQKMKFRMWCKNPVND
jgi:hypothetical protein